MMSELRTTGEATVRIALAEDSLLVREGVVRLLEAAGFLVVAVAGDAGALLDQLEAARPDVVIVDIRMPPTYTKEGLEAARRIRELYPKIGVLVLSEFLEPQYATQLLTDNQRSTGYLLKNRVVDVDEFVDAIRRVGRGGTVVDPEVVSQLINRQRRENPLDRLTEREREVLRLMAEGRSNHSICQRLFLSPKTVEAHVRNIFNKLDLAETADDHRRVLAVLAFLRS
jgi:DNA-binding NarL/FixJ family response regulator